MSVMQKLRTIAIQAQQKIHKNRNKKVPGKWPEKGYDEQGERNWLGCPRSFLYDKLEEEVGELKDACENNEPLSDMLKEAGDVTALTMMIADHKMTESLTSMLDCGTPKVVCLCGSTKFREEFQQANFRETMAGNIVLSVGFFAHVDKSYTLTPVEKTDLDILHKHKIDLADEILVINVNGYIGDSTRSEIDYARATGKPVRWLQIPNPTD